MNAVLRSFAPLTKRLNPAVRASIMRRYQAMERELNYLKSKDDKNLAVLRGKNWKQERLFTLFMLNCIYQELLGPMQSSARASKLGLGRETPIKHGSTYFDVGHSSAVNKAMTDFSELMRQFEFQQSWLTQNTAGDLVYWIARYERERGEL